MFTILADAMFSATLARRGGEIPDHLKENADRFVSKKRRRGGLDPYKYNPYRDTW